MYPGMLSGFGASFDGHLTGFVARIYLFKMTAPTLKTVSKSFS
jgi:hypothetical protein